MKAILSYGNYLNFGKQYQVKFVYENELEVKTIEELIKKIKEMYPINPIYEKQEELKNTNIINMSNIPKDILLPFISMLILLKNTKVIIGNEEFTNFDLNTIENAIDKLHINIFLFKGNYFELENKYYIIFKYANAEQSNEISYEFFNRLYPINIENVNRIQKDEEYMIPFLIDKNGNLTLTSSRIIGGTNIPDDMLLPILKIFVEKYDAILTIGNEKLKNTINEEKFKNSLRTIETSKARIRKLPAFKN